jgi:endonuclease III
MKDGTKYAGRLKEKFAELRAAVSEDAVLDEPTPPLDQLCTSILGMETGEEKARQAIERCFQTMVDWNELRVSTPEELQEATGLANESGRLPCRDLIKALSAIYARENVLSLDHLKAMPRREARQYLESLDGVDAYAAASVMLWSLGGHAIPVNERLVAALREADLVHPDADRHEIQAFLERNVSATDGRAFCLAMRSLPLKTRSGKPGRPKATAQSARRRSAGKRSKRSATLRKATSKAKSKTKKKTRKGTRR